MQEVKNRMSKFTKRGASLPSLKEPAASRPIVDIAPPAQVIVPLVAGDGTVCRPAAGLYETVTRGGPVGLPELDGGLGVPASVSGVLADLREMSHPLLGDIPCAVIDCMAWGDEVPGPPRDTGALTAEEIRTAARFAAVVDELDGRLLADKLDELREGGPCLLVADATEQEPYASSAWAVLNESPVEVNDGLSLAARAAGTGASFIAVRAPRRRRRPLEDKLDGRPLYAARGRYPAALAPLSNSLTVRRVGVQACLSLYRAAAYAHPQCDVVVTVTGDAVANPQNVRVPVGTLVEDLLHFCGLSKEPEYILLGDAMTGLAVSQTDVPVIPGIACVVALTARPQPPTRTCIGCGRCVRACHAGLLPFEIMRRLDNMQYERLQRLLPEECDGCGACSYVCPAGLEVTAKVLEARDAHGNIFLEWGDGDDL